MSILSYKKFVTDQFILEALRDMKFVLSPRLIEALTKINHVISDELLKLHNDLDSKTRQTFVDTCDGKDDTITFIQANKASELLNIEDEEKYSKIDKSILKTLPLSSEVYKQHRSEIKIGRFINNIFGATKFPSSGARGVSTEKPNDVESFVRLYKATFGQEEKFMLIDVVKGDQISHFYNSRNYNSDRDGSLGSSCMSSVSHRYFDIYSKNPDSVSMIILYKNDSKLKIKGRAIVWKLDSPDSRYFMDRIYTNNSSDEELFIEYAKKQGWLYRNNRGYGSGAIMDGRDNSSGSYRIEAQLSSTEHNKYPYMDTMIYYNSSNGKISNQERGMTHILQRTGGDFDRTRHYREREVNSIYEGHPIYESEAKWCEFGEDWVLSNHAIKVWNTGDKYAVPGNKDIVHSYIPNVVDKYFEKSRSTWSEYLNTWIFNGSLINVWTDFEKSNSVIDYKKRSGITFAEVDGEFWKIDLVKKVGKNWVLKQSVKTITSDIKPVNKPKGWHKMSEFIDDEGNIFRKGKYAGKA